jgi:ABC-type bacteriocin/lantibiotic exporter with double-glycine peptidase domain
MKLDVPSYRQTKDSIECGAICIKMILSFYDIELSKEEIRDNFDFYGYGLSMPQLGSFFIKQ